MARPTKQRHVYAFPVYDKFGPCGKDTSKECDRVTLMLDEYEAIRLIDLEGMNQAEAAESMEVARTTVQAIYQTARQKVADALCNGKQIVIEEGDCFICHDTVDANGNVIRVCKIRRPEDK